jgi:hypothetical protein
MRTIPVTAMFYRPKPIQRESREQQATVRYSRIKWPEVPIVCSTGGKKMSGRTQWARIKQGHTNKLEGYEKGTPDLFFSVARRGFHGLYIEMKDTGGVPSDVTKDQREFGCRAVAQGYAWFVCFGHEQAEAVLNWYHGEREELPNGCLRSTDF